MSKPYCDCGEYYEGYHEAVDLIVGVLETRLADDYVAIFDTDGNSRNISKEKFIELVKESI
jgi:hypothetical protein